MLTFLLWLFADFYPGIVEQRLSKYNMDGSERAEEMAKRHFEGNWMEMLGQLQLSFVLFLAISVIFLLKSKMRIWYIVFAACSLAYTCSCTAILFRWHYNTHQYACGQSLQGLEHWKNLVALLCSCGDLARSNPSVMSEFVRLLRRQIEQLPEDFFKDELLCDSFLNSSLRSLCQEAEWVDEADANLQSGSLLFKWVCKLNHLTCPELDRIVRPLLSASLPKQKLILDSRFVMQKQATHSAS